MPHSAVQLVYASLALVMLTLAVGAVMLVTRVREMRRRRIHPQAAATSVTMGATLESVQAADNFRNLFEVPVLFHCLVCVALAVNRTPDWLVAGCWSFVVLRVLHSVVHCTYNRVYHRLAVFLAGFGLLVGMWVRFALALAVANGARY